MKKRFIFIGAAAVIYWIMSKKIVNAVSDNTDIQHDKFIVAVNFLIDSLEGTKYEDNPNDAGGPTKFGIDSRSHPNEDIENLTRERAIEIYLESYWSAGNLNLIPTKLQLQHFCGIAVMGISGHSKVLQRAANVIPDGDLGPISLAAIKFITPERVADFEKKHYNAVIATNQTDEEFRNGWYNRIALTLTKQQEANNTIAGTQKILA